MNPFQNPPADTLAAARLHVKALTDCGFPREALLRALLEECENDSPSSPDTASPQNLHALLQAQIANHGSFNSRLSVSTTSSKSSKHASVISTATTMSSVSSQGGFGGSAHDAAAPQLPPAPPAPPVKSNNRGSSKPQGAYWCTFCDVAFQRKFDWKRHEDEFHERYKRYPCPDCNRLFWGANTFNQHHKNAHGCTTCPHADRVVRYTHKKTAWACGFCGGFQASRDRYFDHVARHYDDGCNKTHWQHSLVIYGLLHQPAILQAWKELKAKLYDHLPRNQQPMLQWDPATTGHAQGFLEGECQGNLQDLLEFFVEGRDDPKFLARLAHDMATIVPRSEIKPLVGPVPKLSSSAARPTSEPLKHKTAPNSSPQIKHASTPSPPRHNEEPRLKKQRSTARLPSLPPQFTKNNPFFQSLQQPQQQKQPLPPTPETTGSSFGQAPQLMTTTTQTTSATGPYYDLSATHVLPHMQLLSQMPPQQQQLQQQQQFHLQQQQLLLLQQQQQQQQTPHLAVPMSALDDWSSVAGTVVDDSMFTSAMALVLAGDADKPSPRTQEYDYIIVGGGTAGVALAARLSQGLQSSRILVVEAGPSALQHDGINVPGLKGSTVGGPLDWKFVTAPQPGLNNRSLRIPRGRVLGGSSAINLLAWNRASAPEYDAWESLGNPGWNWRTLSAAMEKGETYINGPPGSGSRGPIKAALSRFVPEHQKVFVPAVAAHFPQLPHNEDSLQGNPIGVMTQPGNIDPVPYNRSYSANAYLPLAGPNLEVLTDAPVAKVNLARPQGKGKGKGKGKDEPYTATGVTLQNGTVLTAHKGVVLSAGSINTPQLLELSGIGRREVLSGAGLEPLIDLPGVGENYQEHPRVQISFALREGITAADWLNVNTSFAAEEWAKRLRGEPGFYDDSGAEYVFADWVRAVERPAEAAELARLARRVVAGAKGSDVELRKQLELLSDERVPQVEVIYSPRYTGAKGYPPAGSPLHGRGFFTLIGGLMHPLSRGSVHVDPSDPVGKPPVLDPGLVGNEYDLAGLVTLLKFARRLAQTPAVRELWEVEYEPGVDVVQTDEDWKAYIRNTTETVFHPTGTAAMRPRKDGGVVDARLTVYGTANLKVVDASIMPVQISAHPQTIVYGIAEKAAEIMIAEHR
ncbi:hypothetical protein VTJ49DRAFT_778 [Mycothermus thermophilus]|uniref:C2H2-type domain-containing protein n=1 Tax=Humicola insolens TaxID=85995 RepID=A0ABR3VF31_HUMIN